MSIQNEINRINENIASTYSALSDMGATMPETQNSANMASTVRTIPQTGGNTEAVYEVTCTFREGGDWIYSVSATFEEIYNAVKVEHKCVVLTAKLGSASYTSEYGRILPMTFISDGAVTFEGIVSGYDGDYRTKVTITNEGVSCKVVLGIGDIYYIYCNVDLDNNTFTPYTATGDLSEVFSGQYTVILTADIKGTSIFLPMSSKGDSGITFSGIVKIDGSFYFVSAEILSDGNKFTITEASPQSGGSGESTPEIYYVDGTFDMQTLTFSTNVTYGEILTAEQAGKYIVAKAQAYMGTYHTNVICLPLTSLDLMSNIAVFDGTMQVNGENIGLAKGLILLAVTVEIDNNGKVITRIKVITTTDVK